MNASTTYKIRKALQRHACPQLVDFSLALADEEYAEIYRLRQLANGEPSRSGPGTTIVNASSPNSWEKIADLEESMMDKLMHAPGNNLMLFTACGMD